MMGHCSTVSGNTRLKIIANATADIPVQMLTNAKFLVDGQQFAHLNDMITKSRSMYHACAPLKDGTMRYTFFDSVERLCKQMKNLEGYVRWAMKSKLTALDIAVMSRSMAPYQPIRWWPATAKIAKNSAAHHFAQLLWWAPNRSLSPARCKNN